MKVIQIRHSSVCLVLDLRGVQYYLCSRPNQVLWLDLIVTNHALDGMCIFTGFGLSYRLEEPLIYVLFLVLPIHYLKSVDMRTQKFCMIDV